ncbi:MAG: hypothetical protein JNK23_19295 [Opitutaceae bacterium]|nr:hypothetical protein [Opitutaceae bacterium]
MRIFRLLAFALAWPLAPLRAAEEALVALPPFLVEEAAKGPPWRFATAPGYEILSRCSDAVTRRVVATHQRLHLLLAEILPVSLQLQCSLPRTLILYDEELQPAASREVIARMLQQDAPAPAADSMPTSGLRGLRAPGPVRRMSFLPNLRLWDSDAMTVFMIVRREDFDAETLSLTKDYVSFLVKGRLPSLPPWFAAGFITLYGQTTYEGERLLMEPLEWISAAHTAAVKTDPKTAPLVAPLGDFFALRTVPHDESDGVDPMKAWQAQAALFVRWGLEAEGGAHRAALWKFTELAAVRGASEELFTTCFGFDFAAAQARLTAYLPTAVRKTATFRLARNTPKPAPIELRHATDGEIARIKGDWERLEVPYVKKISPALASKYLEQARRTFRRAYDRDDRDPRLLAAMGLCEIDAGDTAAGHALLESAARLGPIRPRANQELARLRLAAARAQPAGAEGQLAIDQVAGVLQPAFAARADRPALAEVYETIAEVWAWSAPRATRGHLAVLDEGVRLFPRRTSLVLRAAEVNLRHGFTTEAATFLALAERLPLSDEERARAAALRLVVADLLPASGRE